MHLLDRIELNQIKSLMVYIWNRIKSNLFYSNANWIWITFFLIYIIC